MLDSRGVSLNPSVPVPWTGAHDVWVPRTRASKGPIAPRGSRELRVESSMRGTLRSLFLPILIGLLGCNPVLNQTTGDGDPDDDIVDEPVELPVTSNQADCGQGPVGGSALQIFPGTSGTTATVRVLHYGFSEGCCPEMETEVWMDEAAGTITIDWGLGNDPCDCTCLLDVEAVFTDVPRGRTWTFEDDTESLDVDID